MIIKNELIKKFLVKAISEDDSIVLGIYSDVIQAQKNLEGIINKYLEYADKIAENKRIKHKKYANAFINFSLCTTNGYNLKSVIAK